MNIGITGAGGFLGSHVVKLLRNNPDIDSVEEFNHNKDIFNKDQVEEFVKNKNVIIHLAAQNRADDIELMNTNVSGTLSIVNAIKNKNPNCRLVFASSFQVYSKSTEKDVIDENFSDIPFTVYGFSKKFGEELIKHNLKSYTILRVSNIYGPGCKPFYNSVIATFVELAKTKGEISINGSGNQARDFIYVDDVANAICLASLSNKNGIYNVCSGNATTLNDLASELKNNFPNLKIENKPADEEIIFVKGNFKKAKSDLGFEPNVSLTEGIKKCID